jgi:hypothetical protein
LLSIPVFHKLKAGALAHALPRRLIRDSIDRNSFSGTATSAMWNTMMQPGMKSHDKRPSAFSMAFPPAGEASYGIFSGLLMITIRDRVMLLESRLPDR